jgi:hypothetical protein
MVTNLYKKIALLSCTACGLLPAADTAYTNPVGYVTIPLPGTGGLTPSRLQIASQQLLPSGSTVFSGTAETIVGNTLTDDEGAWSAGNYINPTPPAGFPNHTHLVEVTAGPLMGTFTWITGSAANTLTTYDDISAAGPDASYRIVKAFTIDTLIPGVPPATSTFAGGSASSGDNLLLFNSTTGSYTTFYYKISGGGGTGWRTPASASVNVGAVAIHPTDSGLVFQRKQSADGQLVIAGEVKTGVTDVLIRGKGGTGPNITTLNIIQALIPTSSLTLATSGLYTGSAVTGLLGGSASSGDTVLIYNAATKAYTTYYYKTSGGGGIGWRTPASASLDVGSTVLPSTSAILIQRKSSGVDFTWQIPAVSISQ